MEYNHFSYAEILANKHKAFSPTDFFTCSESDNLQSLMDRMITEYSGVNCDCHFA